MLQDYIESKLVEVNMTMQSIIEHDMTRVALIDYLLWHDFEFVFDISSSTYNKNLPYPNPITS